MIAGVCPAYLPNIAYMAWMISQKEITFVTQGHYQKQTYRNRTEIYGANGKLKLTVPIVHHKNQSRQTDAEVRIHYENKWQKDHWKSLEAAYRSSPYFEFYEDDLYPFFAKKTEKLMELNKGLIHKILSLLQAEVVLKSDTNLSIQVNHKLVIAKGNAAPKNPPYHQVFQSKHGFIGGLSVLDLIFNLGPQSLDYLQKFHQ